MSTPFTSPAGGAWQTLLNEITLAYSERRQALGQSAYTPTDNRDVSTCTYWAGLQTWLETYCTSFIDHVNGPLNDAGSAFRYFTLATWRAAAGLNAAGFRRATVWDYISDPTWSYGHMQAGSPQEDIIGPWIFEDLQKGFGALKWTIRSGTPKDLYQKQGAGSGTGTCATDYALHNSSWASASWVALALDRIYGVDAAEGADAEDGFTSVRHKGKSSLTSIPTMCPSSADVYVLPYTHVGNFVDMDALGMDEGLYFLMETLGESSEADRETSEFGGSVSTAPVNIMGYSCPIENNHASCLVDDSYWVLKWNFTNL